MSLMTKITTEKRLFYSAGRKSFFHSALMRTRLQLLCMVVVVIAGGVC